MNQRKSPPPSPDQPATSSAESSQKPIDDPDTIESRALTKLLREIVLERRALKGRANESDKEDKD